MNPTIQEIFRQLNEQRQALEIARQQIADLKGSGGGQCNFPPQFKAGSIEFPGYLLFPFIQEIEMTSKSKSAFGVQVEESTGSIKIDIDQPVYLERITASLVKTAGQVPGDPDPIPDPMIGVLCPLASYKANPAGIALDGTGAPLLWRDSLVDFEWRIYFDNKSKNISNMWLPSSLLAGDEQDGYRFDCELHMKQGETLTIKARPLSAATKEGDHFELKFQIHMIKMLLDPAKIAAAAAAAEDLR